jgi:molecular chaperone DnaK
LSEPGAAVGIDLGTTNSAVAAVLDGAPRILRSRTGQLLTPSVTAVARNGKRLVGHVAKRQAITNPEDTVFAAKRLIGRRWGSREVEDARAVLPYRLERGPDDDVRVRMGGTAFSIPELSAMILRELRADAEAILGEAVTRAVITVPAYFNDGQRQATKEAGRLAGLEVLRILNEPTSAAVAYGFSRPRDGRVVVFDLGGGTFDVSILDIGASVYDVVGVAGDSYLGGEDFDRRIVEWLAETFAARNGGVDVREDRMALQRLREAAERAKCELSEAPSTSIHLPFLAGGGEGRPALHLELEIGREQLDELTRDLVARCIRVTEQALRDAGLSPSAIDDVVLVGGMTRMASVQAAVRELFGREPSRAVHPEEVVALGAALQAHALTAPVREATDALLLDVTPQDLGILVVGGYVRVIIPRNTTIPTRRAHLFTTSQDGQSSVRISVVQGSSRRAAENELLATFVLEGIRPAPRGEVEIEVTFEVSAEGILGVAAVDRASGRQHSVTVTASSGLGPGELQGVAEPRSGDEAAAGGTRGENP